MNVNRQWCVGARPEGKPKPTDFLYKESAMPVAGEGEVLLETLYLGIAPVMRMYMMNATIGGEPPLAIGDVIHGRGVARVLESHHPNYAIGEIVQGQLGWQSY
jgi:NADPH-dependent curcumin reductase CurA